jgi:hypothetical protein
MSKHFNSGNVFGKVVGEIDRKPSSGGKEFISFEVNVSGAKCGSARAFCRMWGADRFEPLLDLLADNPQAKLALKGFFGQYCSDKNEVYCNFTIYEWQERDSEPRAAFILKGLVDNVMPVKGGQRILLLVKRDGSEAERFELINPDERLNDQAQNGDVIEVKGYVRQENPEDEYGGSSGPVRAFIDVLKIHKGQ